MPLTAELLIDVILPLAATVIDGITVGLPYTPDATLSVMTASALAASFAVVTELSAKSTVTIVPFAIPTFVTALAAMESTVILLSAIYYSLTGGSPSGFGYFSFTSLIDLNHSESFKSVPLFTACHNISSCSNPSGYSAQRL